MDQVQISQLVREKIEQYHPKGGLDQSSKLILSLASINHPEVKVHLERVALGAEATAVSLEKDPKPAFFGGLLHDIGKLVEDPQLFTGRDITPEEYARIKTHAIAGFSALKDMHLFTALCAGLHHNLYQAGYGITTDDIPRGYHPTTVKKILEISTIISICDFIDAATHRKSKILDGSDKKTRDLCGMLLNKYPDDALVVRAAMVEFERLGL